MAFAPRLILVLTLSACVLQAQPASESRAYRTWNAGAEAGGMVEKRSRGPEGFRIESHEWLNLEREGIPLRTDVTETGLKRPDGTLQFTFSLTLSQEPVEGQASWTPAAPGQLQVTFKGFPPRTVDLPADCVLWPGDEEDLLKAAARASRPIHYAGFSVSTLQVTRMDLEPVGPEPLPGFPGTVHYKGRSVEGPLAEEVEIWISPDQGDVKNLGSVGGVSILTQRAELPPPAASAMESGFFERTVKTVPPHPFLAWVPELTVRWTGKELPALPQDPCQRATGTGAYRLARAPLPAAAAERPVQGQPSEEDRPFLAETPLLKFRDPVFDGLMRRLAAPAGATRLELARLVTAFVFDWIREVDYTVGFASAQEVARNPRGDCTEHGVLAVALLRRLGVPARGVTGWVALDRAMGLHFWAEVRIGGAWYPIDPTFDQVPASAFRIKLGATDLADLGTVGWDNAASAFQEGAWVPEAPWAAEVRVQGDTVYGPGLTLRVPDATWTYAGGVLKLDGRHAVTAAPRPGPALPVQVLQGRGGRRGLFVPGLLWVDCGGGAWLQVEGLSEQEAFGLLDRIELTFTQVRKAA